MKKFSILENFKYTDEEIEDFFIDYVDNKKFSLEKGFIDSKKTFFKDISGVTSNSRECKKVTIRLDNIANGIHGRNCKAITNVDSILDILTTIKTFYSRSKEDVNFIIDPIYDSIDIHFFLIGDIINKSHTDLKDEIKNLLSELSIIIKNRGYKRVSLKNSNWLEIRTPVKRTGVFDNDYVLRDIIRRSINGNLQDNERNQPLIEWSTRVTGLNYDISYGGGDNQVVVKLLKR